MYDQLEVFLVLFVLMTGCAIFDALDQSGSTKAKYKDLSDDEVENIEDEGSSSEDEKERQRSNPLATKKRTRPASSTKSKNICVAHIA